MTQIELQEKRWTKELRRRQLKLIRQRHGPKRASFHPNPINLDNLWKKALINLAQEQKQEQKRMGLWSRFKSFMRRRP